MFRELCAPLWPLFWPFVLSFVLNLLAMTQYLLILNFLESVEGYDFEVPKMQGAAPVSSGSVDWSNEDTLRYLSAINCLHNYTLGITCDIEPIATESANSEATKKPSPKGFLTFSDTVEQIRLMDDESSSFNREFGPLRDTSNNITGT